MSSPLSRPKSAQLELFHPPRKDPDYQRLPQEVKQKTGKLLTRLLREHYRRRLATDPGEEACDE